MSTPTRGRRVRGVLFDYGNVIAGIDCDLVAATVSEFGGAGNAAAARVALAAGYRRHDDEIGRGAGHRAGWDALVAALVEAAWGPRDPADGRPVAVVAELWRRQPTRNLWRAVEPEAREILGELRAAGVPLGIVSNSEGALAALLAELDLLDLFDVVVDSGAVGVAKPDPRIFRLAADALRVPPQELVHVGDSESADVEGALGVGATAIRFEGIVRNDGPSRAHARARSYGELRARLSSLVRRS